MFWALRDAVEEKGYYSDANKAKEYYIQLAKEVNEACDLGKVEAINKRSSLTSPFYKKQIPDLLKEIEKTINFEYTLKNMYLRVPMTIKTSLTSSEALFEKVTGNKANRDNTYLNEKANTKVKILENIRDGYKEVNKYILPISVLIYFVNIIMLIFNKTRKYIYKDFLILSGLLTIYMCRIFTVAFIALTAYESAINVLYLSNIYAIQFLFSILSIIFVIIKLINYIKEKTNERRNRINNTNAMS